MTDMLSQRSKELNARKNLSLRFELNLKDCHFVVESLLPALKEHLFEELNVELMTANLKLRQGEGADSVEDGKKQRMDMWSTLKITSFARTLGSIYLVNLVSSMTCVQLSLLGRYVYLDSIEIDQDENVARSISDETERHYLTLSWYLLNVGWKACMERVQKAVEKVVGE